MTGGFTLSAGDVIRYDYLWKQEHDAGRRDGAKDRPCAVVLTSTTREDGSKQVILVAISHTPPKPEEGAIDIPLKLARHLRLDDDRCWIKTHQVNVLSWQPGRIPDGVVPLKDGSWKYGQLPGSLGKRIVEQIRSHARQTTLAQVNRD